LKGSAAVTIEFGWTTGKRDDRHIGPPVLDSADPAAGWFRPGKTIEWPLKACTRGEISLGSQPSAELYPGKD